MTDPARTHAGEILVTAVDRAADLVRRTLDYARGPPPLDLAPVALAPLVRDAAEMARPLGSALRMDNDETRPSWCGQTASSCSAC